MDLSVTVQDVTVSPSSTVRNLGVILDNGLSCTPNITAVARSCKFALYNICRIWSLLTKDTTQILVQPLRLISRLDYQPLWLNWCSVSRTLLHASLTIHPNSPMWPASSVTSTDFLLRPASDSRWWCWSSRSSTELHPSTSKYWSEHTPQLEYKGRSAKSRLSSVLAPQWWNELRTNVRTAEYLSVFHKRLICWNFTSTMQSMTPSPQKCTHLYVRIISTSITALLSAQITSRWLLFTDTVLFDLFLNDFTRQVQVLLTDSEWRTSLSTSNVIRRILKI